MLPRNLLIGILAILPGCCDRAPVTFEFEAAEVWPVQMEEDEIAPDRVLAAGSVLQGVIRRGETLAVNTQGGEILVTVREITIQKRERLRQAEQAAAGDDVALELQGISPETEWEGRRLTRRASD